MAVRTIYRVTTRRPGHPANTLPAAPTNLQAVAGDSEVSLTWRAVSGATSYKVYRGLSSGSESFLIGGITSPSYTDATAVNGTTYYYQVRAVNAVGTGAASSEVSATPSVASGEYPSGVTFLAPTVFDPYIPNLAKTPTIFSTGAGNWSSTGTWDLGRVPQAGDIVGIKGGHTVTYDVVSAAAIKGIGVQGTLTYRTDIDTQLKVQHLIVYEGGTLKVGTSLAPVDAAKTAKITFSDAAINTTEDPGQYGNGLLVFGTFIAHGAAKSKWALPTGSLTAGQTAITAQSGPTGWRAGDKLVIADSRHLYADISPISIWPFPGQRDIKTLVGVSGTTVTVNALTYPHPAAKDNDGNVQTDMVPHVANLTRNVVFESENRDGTRGHALFSHECDVDVQNTLWRNTGRTTIAPLDSTTWDASGNVTHVGTNQIGRYPPHFHHACGLNPPVHTYQFTFKGNVIDNGYVDENSGVLNDTDHLFKWGITLHDSSYGLIQDNVIHNCAGSGIMGEAGGESFNLIDGNYVCRCRGYSQFSGRGDERISIGDFGHEGVGYWFRGPNNYVTNNVAAETFQGYKFFGYADPIANVPNFQGACTHVVGEYTPVHVNTMGLLQFEGNEAYGGWTVDGLQIWSMGNQNHIVYNEFPDSENLIKNARFWNIYQHYNYGYEYNKVVFDGCRFFGDKALAGLNGVSIGFYWGDYISKNFTVRNCHLEGLVGALDLALTDASDPNGHYVEFTDNVVNCMFGVQTVRLYATGGASAVKDSGINIRRCTFSWNGPSTYSDGRPASFIWRFDGDAGSSFGNLRKLYDVYVYDFQNVPGDNFRVYAQSQLGSAIMPSSSEGNIASDDPGKTNTFLLANHGYCTMGAIAPSATTRAGIHGYVEAF